MPQIDSNMVADTIKGLAGTAGVEIAEVAIPHTGNEIETAVKIVIQLLIGVATLISIYKGYKRNNRR
jgi:hypothetical protein